MAPFVATYKGKPADALTRDELITAYTAAVKELQHLRTAQLEDAQLDQYFEQARRFLSGGRLW